MTSKDAIDALDEIENEIVFLLRKETFAFGFAKTKTIGEKIETIRAALKQQEYPIGKFKRGDRVRKKGDKGQWHGHICGIYSATCTSIGYAVESERETGSVQIYPETALEIYKGETK